MAAKKTNIEEECLKLPLFISEMKVNRLLYQTSCILLICFSRQLAFGQVVKEKVDQLKEKQQNLVAKLENDTSGETNFLIYPSLAFTPETLWEFGLINLVLFYANKNPKNRLSEVNTFTFYTQEKQYGIWLDHAIYGNEDKWFFLGRARFQYFPLKYYGIGTQAPPNYEVVSNGSFQLRERVLRQVKGNLYFGLEFDHQRIYNVQFGNRPLPSDYVLPTGYQGSSNTAIGAGLVYDNRRNVLNVREGMFAEIAYLNYGKWLGSTYQFNLLQYDARYFTKGFKPNHVFAAQSYGAFNNGNVPFNQLALMGGESLMRGYYLGRFRDNCLVALQTEYRILPFSFSKRWGAAAFASVGNVAPSIGSFNASTTKVAAGLGARFLVFKAKDIFVRADLAFTNEGNGFYFFIGEAF